MEPIVLKPIAYIHNERRNLQDDYWGEVISEIVLDDSVPEESLQGIESYSDLEVIYFFHRADPAPGLNLLRRPRERLDWPLVGIFAQRNKDRPNHLGLTTVSLLQHEGKKLVVKGLDAIDGTPVLDIKPVMQEYLPGGMIRQPAWSHELMKNYWNITRGE